VIVSDTHPPGEADSIAKESAMSISRGHSMGEAGLTFASLLLIVAMISLLAMVAIPPMVTYLSPRLDTDKLHRNRSG
jgi:hypothetical protein